MKRFLITAVALLTCGTGLAQENSADLAARVRALEEKVSQMQQAAPSPQLDEVRREIDILTREIEALKSGQTRVVATADTAQYGLGAAASKVYRSEPGVSFGGYGEFAYAKPASPEPATANLNRAVLYTGYKFNDRALFNSELEVEGASTERGGQVSVEFAYLDYLIRPEANVRAGVMLMPVGLINEQHEPTAYFGARRPAVEHDIIPATWGDFGLGLFGDAGRFSYRAYLVTGLDSSGFGPEEGVREGRQAGASAVANDWATVGRLDFHPFEGTTLGGSLYSGSSGQTRDFNARVTLGELHAESRFRGAQLRALWSRGSLGDAAAVNHANGLEGEDSVGRTFGGWYAEGGYDVAPLFGRTSFALSPYARFENLDTQRSVPAGFERNPRNARRITTLGLELKPVPQAVIKADVQRTRDRAGVSSRQLNVGVGYIF